MKTLEPHGEFIDVQRRVDRNGELKYEIPVEQFENIQHIIRKLELAIGVQRQRADAAEQRAEAAEAELDAIRSLTDRHTLADAISEFVESLAEPYDEHRQYFKKEKLSTGNSNEEWDATTGDLVDPEDANLISSRTNKNTHRPALDIDFPAKLLPSSTEGHFHLYLERDMSWGTYEKLLRALAEAGVIEYGFMEASIQKKMSQLRVPGVYKDGKGA